jgi:hypothetical protein
VTAGQTPYLSDAKTFAAQFKKGTKHSPAAFRNLVELLLQITVARDGETVRLVSSKAQKNAFDVQSWQPLRLRNDRYLWVVFNLVLDQSDRKDGKRLLRVVKSAASYLADRDRKQPIFRYEYLRKPENKYAGSHFHIRGRLDVDGVLAKDKPLEKVHFPTSRVSLEAVIRLLAEDFAVPTREKPEVWRPVLAWTEETFLEIAHRDISGPRL